MSRLTLDEMETIITISRRDNTATICSTDPVVMNKLDKLVDKSEDWDMYHTETIDGEVVEKFYHCPKNLISFRSKKSEPPKLSAEQQKKGAEALRQWRESQKA